MPELRTEMLPFAAGAAVRVSRTVSAQDIDRFATAIDSHNAIHDDKGWVDEHTPFGKARIAHGFLTASLVSRAIVEFFATFDLTGALCYTESTFVAPLRSDTEVVASLTFVSAVPQRGRLRFNTHVADGAGRTLMVGEVHEHLFSIGDRWTR